jgi:hypothetical protein
VKETKKKEKIKNKNIVTDWAVARRRIGKHVPTNQHSTIARQQTGKHTSQQRLRNNREAVFCGVRADELFGRQLTLLESVEGSPVECYPAGNGSGIISLAKIRYQETSSEDTAEEL